MRRSPANKVLPAMYIEGVTKQAFADIASDDPDFSYIQGVFAHIKVVSGFSCTVNSTKTVHEFFLARVVVSNVYGD